MLLAIFSAPLFADLGHVNLIMTGTVLQESCDISADTKNQTVTIGSFSSAEFKSVGSVTTAVPFTIQLNKCSPNISTAGVTFNGTQFGSDPTQLALTDTSGSGDLAVGVVVQVLDNNGPIALNSVNARATRCIRVIKISCHFHYVIRPHRYRLSRGMVLPFYIFQWTTNNEIQYRRVSLWFIDANDGFRHLFSLR